MANPSGAGLTRSQYLAKLRGARGLYGAGSPQVQSIRSSYYGPKISTPKNTAGAPAPPSYPPPTGLPFSATYDATVNATNRNLANNETDFAAQESSLNRDYFDPNNPYNQANLLKESYQRQSRAAATQLASGQLYSGAFQNAQDATLQDYQRGENALHTDYADQVAELIRKRQRSRDEATSSVELAGANRLDNALANPAEDPGAPAPAAPAPKPAAAPKPSQPGGPPPGKNYVWDPSRYQWAYSGPSPGSGYRFDPIKRKWVRK